MTLYKILSVDDSKAVQALLREHITELCSQFDTAADGAQGLDKALTNSYDLIFLDWEMPVLNGPETLKKLRESQVSAKIIMLTTKNSVEDIKLVLSLGADDYIMKPFTKEILHEKIHFHLSAS